jgi:F-type H+-transporting ATPase subunit b
MDRVAESIRQFVDSALGVSLEEMIIQISATLLLFLIVRFFFWNNITAYLEKRKEAMNEEYDQAKQANADAQSIKETTENELKEIRLSAKGLYDEAKDRGEVERKEIVLKAKADAKKIVDNAHKEINSEIEKARTSINDEIVSVATLMAEKIIKKEIDKDKHKELIDEVTEGVVS